MSFFSAWLHAPSPRTRLSRYTELNGFFYLGLGGLLFVAPGLPEALLGVPAWIGREEGLFRLVGLTIALIGYFYVFGARTNADSFGLSSVVDRLLVPLFVVPLVLSGAVPGEVALPLAVLDPLLGLGAYVIWRGEQGASTR
jgi:hypothetical protein